MTDIVCQIVRGDIEAAVVHRDEQVVAFLDHRPVFKGHVLVAPVEHVDTLLDLPPALMVPVVSTAQGYPISKATKSTTSTMTGSTISGGTRPPSFLPENTGTRETIRNAMPSV